MSQYVLPSFYFMYRLCINVSFSQIYSHGYINMSFVGHSGSVFFFSLFVVILVRPCQMNTNLCLNSEPPVPLAVSKNTTSEFFWYTMRLVVVRRWFSIFAGGCWDSHLTPNQYCYCKNGPQCSRCEKDPGHPLVVKCKYAKAPCKTFFG